MAGFQTQGLFPSGETQEDVELLGTLTSQELEDVLARAEACLCYQEVGAGALTRICEMLIAGIPVVANSHAARSYYGTKGLIEIRDPGELEPSLNRLKDLGEEIPVPAKPGEDDFIRQIEGVRP